MVSTMRSIPPILTLLLVACNGPADEPVPADKLPGEEQAVADAQAMIDEHPERLEGSDASPDDEGTRQTPPRD